MNPKRLLFTLFLLYWVGVYGVTFFAGKNLKSQFRDSIPTGYRMFAPVTNTQYDAVYKFYLNNEAVKEIKLSDYVNSQYEKPIYLNKTAYVKDKLFQGSLKVLDFRYQKSLYDELYRNKENDFEAQTLHNPELSKIITNLKNFSQYYLNENPEIKADSVVISVSRSPFILPFAPEYKDDFTHKVGKKIFYTTFQTFNP